MYTIGRQELPSQEFAVGLNEMMAEDLRMLPGMPHIEGYNFYGTAYRDTEDPERFEVIQYVGRITSLVVEPPAFNLLVEKAVQQVAPCDCPDFDANRLFDEYELVMEEAQIAEDIEELTGTPVTDPHWEDLSLAPNTEVTIRFGRVGGYGVSGVLKPNWRDYWPPQTR